MSNNTVPCATCQKDCCYNFAAPQSLALIHNCCYCGIYFPVKLAPNKAYHHGTILAEIMETFNGNLRGTGVHDAYDPTATNGLQVPKLILVQDARSDDKGFDILQRFELYACNELLAKGYRCIMFDITCLSDDIQQSYENAQSTGFVSLITAATGRFALVK